MGRSRKVERGGFVVDGNMLVPMWVGGTWDGVLGCCEDDPWYFDMFSASHKWRYDFRTAKSENTHF